MANVISSITAPELAFAANTSILKAQRALRKVSMFATDFSAEAAQLGSTMMVQFFDDGEADNYDEETNNYGHADGSSSMVPVTFTNHPKKTFALKPTDTLESVNGQKFFTGAGEAIGRAVSRAIFRTVSAQINSTNIKNDPDAVDEVVDATGRKTGTLLSFGAWNEAVFGTGAFSKKAVSIQCRQYCDAAEIDAGECVLMLNAKAYGEVLADLDAHAYGGTEAIRSGMIEGLYGFGAVMENDLLLKNENLVGAIIPRNAIGVAGRTVPILNPHLVIDSGTVTDEGSGLTLTFRRIGDANTDRTAMTGEALFGAKLLQPTKIVRIVSATPSGE
jgi:hypothetical protein